MRARTSAGRTLSTAHATAAALTAALALLSLTMVSLPGSAALFTSDYPVAADFAAGRIFRAEHLTPAFYVVDQSSGTPVDVSSGDAFSDAHYFLTRSWPLAFDANRYIEIDLNDPLPAGLPVSNPSVTISLRSDTGVGSACFYGELRRASSSTLIVVGGSAGSPIGCTSGTTPLAMTIALTTLVPTTDVANDLRIRLYARDSAGGAVRLDRITISGDTPYATFTLYPILTREAFDGQLEVIPWSLAGP